MKRPPIIRYETVSNAKAKSKRRDGSLKRLVSLVGTLGLLFALVVSTPVPGRTSSAFSFNWNGLPAAPQSVVPPEWDVQIHKRDVGDTMDTMQAQHGADCSAPPATHTITALSQGVFICKNHLMTAIGDEGYGEIALTSDHLVDFSSGTASIQVSVSTLQLNDSDFVEVWVTPFAENMALPFICCDPDLQGPPKHALRFSLNHAGILGSYEGDVVRYDNFSESSLPKALTSSLATLVPPSATARTTYEIDLSTNHVRFGLPTATGGVWWTDANTSTLPFTQGIVQLVHHSYNPNKHCPGCGVDTWHWSNFAISNAVPFTIISGNERSIHAGVTTVHFPAPAPANAFLRFSGIGPQGSTYMVSYDGGATWTSPDLQKQQGTHPEHFSTYWTRVPAGTQTVLFKGQDWWGGPWWVRDPAIWSLSSPDGSTAAPTPLPSPAPPPSPLPSPSPTIQTPIPITSVPCIVTMQGLQQPGFCTGTFIKGP